MTSVETVTILITDLVGSTRLESRVGPTVAEKLRQEHFGALREAIEEHAGSEVKNTGDGLMVAFPSAAGAIECARAMQQRIELRNRGAEESLSIRIGISMGDATREGDDYFGVPSIQSARLCDAADGDQILVPELVKMMVGGREGLELAPVGALELKGLPAPLESFEVRWEPLGAQHRATPLPPALAGVPPGGYVGRTEERQRLRSLYEQIGEGHRRAGLLSGDPGIGKTRLATLTALDAYAEGATVLWGHCTEDLDAPYAAWIEALSHYVEHAPEEVLQSHVERHGGEVCRLVPSLHRRLAEVPAPRETDPETERYLLFGAVAGLLEAAAEDSPVVLVLDDLHWADKQTLSLLQQVTSAAAGARLLLLGTFRESDLRRSHPLTEVLANLRRVEGVERVALHGLEQGEVAGIMEAAAGHALDAPGLELCREIAAQSDGNPFFVIEILRHLRESGAIAQREDGHWHLSRSMADLGLPQGVREVVGRRVEQLGPDVERPLTAAAVIGREFEIDLLGRVVDGGEDALLDALDAAVEASILVESSEATGRFTFASALFNQTLYDGLGGTRRARLHRRVAEALEDLCGEDPGARLGELAHHWAAATTAVDPDKALRYAQRAGERALAELAPDEAMRWFGQALDLHTHREDADDREHCELSIGLGEAQRQAGDADFRETLLRASDLARDLGDADLLARAVIANNRGFQSATGLVDDERVGYLEAALELHGDRGDARRAVLLAILAQELLWNGDFELRKRLSDEALDLARRSGDPRTLAHVLTRRYSTTSAPETLAQRVEDMAELGALAERLQDPSTRFLASYYATCAAQEVGDIESIERHRRSAEGVVREVGEPAMLWLLTCSRHVGALMAGRLDEAEALAEEAGQIGTDSGQSDALTYYVSQLHAIRWADGRADELVDLAAQMVEDNPGIQGMRALLASVYCESGRLDEAREVLAPIAAKRFEDLPHDMLWLAGMSFYAAVAAQVEDRSAAGSAYELLLPWAGQVPSVMITAYPCVDHFLGRLSATLGRHDEANAHFTAAAAIHEALGAPVFLACTRMEWARALLARGAADDPERAASLLQQAGTIARELGAGAVAERAAALAAEADGASASSATTTG